MNLEVPIGQFARLCRLSVKQLRHYDRLGLLAPARVDADTGYRYYRPDQAADALVIGLLRSLDVPLAAIGAVLAGRGAAEALGRVRDDLEAELGRRRRTLGTLERVLAEGLPTPAVSVVTEPARRVFTARDVADGPGDLGRATSACVARLLPLVGRPELFGEFPLDLDGPIPVLVAAAHADGPDLLPGGTFACATHVGPYDQILLTAHALLSWCAAHGQPPAGPVREVYLSDPGTTAPDRLVTQLLIPVEEPV